jgi:hypothetical protein
MRGWRFPLLVLLWLIPATVIWIGAKDFLNVFLRINAEHLLHLGESPNASRLYPAEQDRNYIVIERLDFPSARARVSTVRVTDVHFHLILLAGLFLAVPGLSWRARLKALGWGLLITLLFDILLLYFWVKFTYATQLGSWSVEHYGAFSRNLYGLGKHLLDLPFKLGLPLALFVVFHYRRLVPVPGEPGKD